MPNVFCPCRKCDNNRSGECVAKELNMHIADYDDCYFPYCILYESQDDPYDDDEEVS